MFVYIFIFLHNVPLFFTQKPRKGADFTGGRIMGDIDWPNASDCETVFLWGDGCEHTIFNFVQIMRS